LTTLARLLSHVKLKPPVPVILQSRVEKLPPKLVEALLIKGIALILMLITHPSLNGYRFRTFQYKSYVPPGNAPKMVAADGGRRANGFVEKGMVQAVIPGAPLTSALSSTSLAPITATLVVRCCSESPLGGFPAR
jgi:hypothetical protein